jgi:hypothetical protein
MLRKVYCILHFWTHKKDARNIQPSFEILFEMSFWPSWTRIRLICIQIQPRPGWLYFFAVLWIRIQSDQKLFSGSGKKHSRSESEQLRIRNEF